MARFRLKNSEHDFIRKIRGHNNAGYEAWVYYIDGVIEVYRANSNQLYKLDGECLIDTFGRFDSEVKILNAIEKHIREYEERKAAQSKRLNETLGLFHNGRR